MRVVCPDGMCVVCPDARPRSWPRVVCPASPPNESVLRPGLGFGFGFGLGLVWKSVLRLGMASVVGAPPSLPKWAAVARGDGSGSWGN